MTTLSFAQCFLIIDDPDSAVAFYRDALGLEVRNDVSRGEFRWITVGAPTQPEVAVVLTNYLNGSPADRDAMAELVAKGALNGVHFHADDLDAAFARVRDADAEVVSEPTEQPWGSRDFAIRDPAGNLIRVDQRAAVTA